MQSLATQPTVQNFQQTFRVSMDNESVAPQTISFDLIVSREGEISIDVRQVASSLLSETSVSGRSRTIEIVVGSGSAIATVSAPPRLNNSHAPIASSSTAPLAPARNTASIVLPLRTTPSRSHNQDELPANPVQAPSTSPTTRRGEPAPNTEPPSTTHATPTESIDNEDPPPYSHYPPARPEDLIPHPPAPRPQVLPRIVQRTRLYPPGPIYAPYIAAPLPPMPRIRDLYDAMQRGEFVPQILPVEDGEAPELPWGGSRARRTRGRYDDSEDDDSEDERPAKRSRVSWGPFDFLRSRV
ncbi:hypothetical protein DFH06DRAFT_1146641 [Mycena polygramma]|nr:hypothetical protein DFH06DRAFT_1148072 [Mycena polygramma]KAJ7613902.1 hypothetical protein DFH06DRAFT_1146641 [Mycena polygramma]